MSEAENIRDTIEPFCIGAEYPKVLVFVFSGLVGQILIMAGAFTKGGLLRTQEQTQLRVSGRFFAICVPV